MGVEIPPPFLDLVVQVGDAVDDGHWRFLFPTVFRGARPQSSKTRRKKRAGAYIGNYRKGWKMLDLFSN
jgi:hypothetical protein